MNPYDFIPLGDPSPRSRTPGHHLLAERGGIIHARLTTRGPFLIAKQGSQQNRIVPFQRGKIIPGSSLKGVIRSMAEIVGGGCIRVSSSLYRRGSDDENNHAREPVDFRPCSDLDRLCVTCRMFGALVGHRAWKGMVEPGDGRWHGTGAPRTKTYNVIVGEPKPNHRSFYVNGDKIRGRKAYYHHAADIMQSAAVEHATYGRNQTYQVCALEPEQVYHFTIRHQGLDEREYALLLYAVFLEDGLAHKFGWGKPMGFGSVEIDPIAIEEIDLHARYRRGGDGATVRYEGGAATAHARELTKRLRAETGDVMTAVRRMLAFPGPDERWAYPSYLWFKRNREVSLDEFNAGRDSE